MFTSISQLGSPSFLHVASSFICTQVPQEDLGGNVSSLQEFEDLVVYVNYHQKCKGMEVMIKYIIEQHKKQIEDIVVAKLEDFEE